MKNRILLLIIFILIFGSGCSLKGGNVNEKINPDICEVGNNIDPDCK